MSPEEEKVINRNTMKLQEHLYKSLKQRDQYKADNEKLERENEQLSELNKQLTFEIRNYEHEIKALRLQADTYFDEWQNTKALGYETYNEAIKYSTLTNHIRLKAENNPGVSRYIDLVNYIDRLEEK
ncbi:hypothetical protein AABD41_14980 [Staphylococcus pseudoxylosus]|uniref:hypothetical protein n=1 Tax=Staphylococcus pseudoxylosus TaxID=2282419 RepID=UPI00398BB015